MDDDDDTNSAIRKLNEDSIRRIVAEQAITDLSSIVKELVDNAIDAESTTIKIRLFGHGLEIVEVSDDGFGVPLQSRDQLAMRYATSKIRSFEDIYNGTGLSMGFRGEALFSMACLSSQLVVASRTESEDVAQKMAFQRDGSLDKSSVTAVHRKVGTTVAVLKPFAHLPARRADLARRIRAERSKLFKLMEKYAIFNVGVAIHLLDIVGGREDVALATSSTSNTLEENVSAVMGHKFLSTLAPIEIKLGNVVAPNEEDNMHDWGIKGLMSRNPQADPPSRSITCFSVNGRIVQLPKLAALLRKLWTGFAGRKKPSCILSFTLPNCSFDINLSPDKQQILLLNEDAILDVFSNAVTDFYSSQVNGRFAAKLLEQPVMEEVVERERQKHKRRFAFVHDLSKAKLQHDLDDRDSSKKQKIEQHDKMSFRNSQKEKKEWGKDVNLENVLEHKVGSGYREDELTRGLVEDPEKAQRNENEKRKQGNLSNEVRKHSANRDSTVTNLVRESTKSSVDERAGGEAGCRSRITQELGTHPSRSKPTDYERQKWTEIQSKFRTEQSRVEVEAASAQSVSTATQSGGVSLEVASNDQLHHRVEQGCSSSKSIHNSEKRPINSGDQTDSDMIPNKKKSTKRGEVGEANSVSIRPFAEVEESLPHTIETSACHEKTLDGRGKRSSANIKQLGDGTPKRRSSTSLHWASFLGTDKICTQARTEQLVQQKPAEDSRPSYGQDDVVVWTQDDQNHIGKRDISQSLQANVLSLSKGKFRGGMRVLGQFNLGFILCLCNERNLWIFDQHACDEKYNFEKLRRETKMHEQKLLKPMAMELTASEEICILDNIDVFEANGFRFEFRPKSPIRQRLLLTALPHSGAQEGRKAVQFGQEDVRAICAILSDGASYEAGDGGTGTDGSGKFGNNAVRYASMASGQQDRAGNLIARLPKAISMFASRSCRSSIMIGTALSHAEMQKIVSRLADVEFPWTCPHGRPTLRHVGNAATIISNDEDKIARNSRLLTHACMGQKCGQD